MYKGKSSPWGIIDHCRELAEGVHFVGTPGHGGIKLDRKRNALVPTDCRRAGGWYEEDCEWAIPALVFPEAFPASQDAARKTLCDHYPETYNLLTDDVATVENSYALAQRAFIERTRDKWVVVSAVLSDDRPGMVECWAYLGGRDKNYHFGGERRKFLVPDEEYQTRGKFSFVIEDPSAYEEVACV